MATKSKVTKIKVTLTGSVIGCTKQQKETVKALGLRKRGSTRELQDTPAVKGAIRKVAHLVAYEEV